MTNLSINRAIVVLSVKNFFKFTLAVFFLIIAGTFALYLSLRNELPNIESLQDVQWQTPMQIYSSDGLLISQFGEKKRVPLTFDEIPQQLIEALLATEDDRFYFHFGVDPIGMARAVLGKLTGNDKGGASTITMQVARNFFLTREITYTRKIREIFLSFHIESLLTKNEILALYINKIPLGHRSFGFGAAAQVYYGKNINELSRLMTYPSYSIIRKDLMGILIRRAIELDIDVYFQHDVTSLSDTHGSTSVKFSNGKSIQPDIIIGSDGRMRSLSRQYVNGSNTPIYQGFINWVGVFEDKSVNFSDLSVSDYWGAGERFGIVPISKNKAYWAGGIVSKNISEVNPNEFKSELHSLFNSWPSVITKIIDKTPESSINKIYVHDHDPIDKWHKNNVILLGDAAHSPLPTSGQGACQALEDAWHITRCLKENINDIAKAFEQFTELRKSKTSGITMGGRQLASSIFNQDVEFCKHRNLASKNTNYQGAVIGMAKGWSSGLPISA